jgi:hypothetical protein
MKKRDPAPVGDARPKTVYLSAPLGIDTRPIRRALEDKGLDSFSPDQLDLPGQRLPDILREGISRADLILAVVDPTPASNNVYFEVGYARGLGKPTFVLLTDDAPTSLWVSSGIPYFKFNPDHPTGLDFAVTQILAIPHHGTQSPSAPAKQTRPLGDRVDELLAHLREKGENISDSDLKEIIGRAIRESAVTSVSGPGRDAQSVDFSVWSDDFSPWVGNPVAIEVKRIVGTGMDVSAAMGQMLHAMTRSGIPFGLLIYVKSRIDVSSAITVPNIAAISAEDFLEGLRTTPFGELVRHLRNKRVHGGS